MSNDLPKVSKQNSKDEIFEAWRQAFKAANEKVQATVVQNPVEVKVEKERATTAATTVKEFNLETILKGTSSLKLAVSDNLDDLNSTIIEAHNRLEKINAAAEQKEKELKENLAIEKNALTLQALYVAHEESKAKLREEMKQLNDELEAEIKSKKEKWVEEQNNMNKSFNDMRKIANEKFEREDEDYIYSLRIKRRNEEQQQIDKNNIKQRELESEWQDKEFLMAQKQNELIKREENLEELVKQVADIPNVVKAAVAKNEGTITNAMKKDYETKTILAQKDFEMQLKELQTENKSLIENVNRLIVEKESLTNQLSIAMKDVKEIANSAVNSSKANIIVGNDGNNSSQKGGK